MTLTCYDKVTHPCDVCGHSDHIVGVAASGLGPCSFNFCGICLRMGAEPRHWVEAAVESCGGIEHVHSGLLLTFYDKETDSYKDVREGDIPIKIKDSTKSFKTRNEFVIYAKEKGFVNHC